MLFGSILETIGRTPLVTLGRLTARLDVTVYAKLEGRSPCGSVKDRVGLALIEDAERRGELTAGATLVEPTSGNTGLALAFAAAAKGYRLVLTMPERISRERVALLRSFGVEVVLTPGSLMRAAVDEAQAIKARTPGAVMLQQFDNPANPEVHRRTTAVEIWEATGGRVDVLVCGVGTGGTITGVGEVLKARKPDVHVVAVEPAAAAVLSGGQPGHHFVPGLGAGFVPKVLNRAVIDEIVAVTEKSAFEWLERLARTEGISAGISSGAALAATMQLANKPEHAGKRFVVVLPDQGERYIASATYEQMRKSFGG